MNKFLKAIGLSALMIFLFGVPLSFSADDLIAPTRSLEGSQETPGKLTIFSEPPDQQVFLDGSEIGRTPVRLQQVKPGAHEIRIAKSKTDVFIEPGKTLTLSHFKGDFIVIPEQKEVAKEPPPEPEDRTKEGTQTKPPEEKKSNEPTPWDRFINKSSPIF